MTDNKTDVLAKDGTTWTIEPEEYSVKRTGAPPMKFKGALVGGANNRGHQGTRWDEYRLYVTTGGRYVLVHEYCTQWQGETGHKEALVGDTVADLLAQGARVLWPNMERQEYPEVINDLLDDAKMLDSIAETVE